MKKITKKYQDLCREVKWRFKENYYKEEDKAQVVLHETINKDINFISISDIKGLSDELGIGKILEIEQDYISEFGGIPKEKKGIDILRLLLYWYFEKMVYEDDGMREFLKLNN